MPRRGLKKPAASTGQDMNAAIKPALSVLSTLSVSVTGFAVGITRRLIASAANVEVRTQSQADPELIGAPSPPLTVAMLGGKK